MSRFMFAFDLVWTYMGLGAALLLGFLLGLDRRLLLARGP